MMQFSKHSLFNEGAKFLNSRSNDILVNRVFYTSLKYKITIYDIFI